jgi:glycosyltransferase involved in cell wall biosynthesis
MDLNVHTIRGKQPPPRISVITPSYNQGRFLGDCIASVVRQSYPDLEYIIIDGGSTDDSVSIIQHHQDQIMFWVSEPDEGQSDAINKGLRKATGDIVAWLNADDYYLPGAFATVAGAYQAHPEASFYFGDGLRVDESGKPISGFFPDGKVIFSHAALVFGLNYILQPATFIRRIHLVEINYLDSRLHYGMDTDLWIRLAELAPPSPISNQLAASREYGSTKTSTGSFQRIEELRRIAEQHSGIPITPGVICYFLDTLYRLTRDRDDVFPKDYMRDIEKFWAASAKLMQRYGARPDGFPRR